MKKFKFITLVLIFLSFINAGTLSAAESNEQLLSREWSFAGLFGKFDRASLQRGYQVYREVCASCHSMKYLSYRNLTESGGPEFTEDEAKAIAASYEITDGPNDDGEMYTRPGRLADKFASPYPNDKAAIAANGGAYPPDMSVLVKARKGGADYIYSVLMGYDNQPAGFELEAGVYYNKFMDGNKIKMPKPLQDDLIEYSDGTQATEAQMASDVVNFLTWSAEPHLEARHRIGFKVIIYLIILSTLVFFSMRKLWSSVDSEK